MRLKSLLSVLDEKPILLVNEYGKTIEYIDHKLDSSWASFADWEVTAIESFIENDTDYDENGELFVFNRSICYRIKINQDNKNKRKGR